MKLNVPDVLKGDRVLMVGIGGGYDLWGGLPLMYTWQHKYFVLANYCRLVNVLWDSTACNLGYPEGKLHSWINYRMPESKHTPLYLLPRVGVNYMTKCLDEIVEKHKIDSVVAIDGGVDSLMHGDEEGCGTVIEDSVTLGAINNLKVEHKMLVCLGFGTELEEGLCHASALDNITQLIRQDAFLGSCSLTKDMEVFDLYKEACEHCWQGASKSHIQTKVISSVVGEHIYTDFEANVVGAKEVEPHISALMSMYWFFDLPAVCKMNKLIPEFQRTNTHTDVVMTYRQMIDSLGRRSRKALPY